MDDILRQLPDERATQRLLSVLEKLEKATVIERKAQKSTAADSSEIKALREQNAHLRQKQKKAADRLDKLLGKLPELFPELSDKPAAEAPSA